MSVRRKIESKSQILEVSKISQGSSPEGREQPEARAWQPTTRA